MIRITSSILSRAINNPSKICALSCASGEEKKEVLAGEMAELTASGEITVSKFSMQDIPDFVMEELSGEEEQAMLETLAENGSGPEGGNGENAGENLILNNGKSLVRFAGNDYYWKYTADSVDDEGLFAHFYLKPEADTQMICHSSK